MTGREESKLTNLVHIGCGGPVVITLDSSICARCRAELTEADWRSVDVPPHEHATDREADTCPLCFPEDNEPLPYSDADRAYDLWAFAQDYGSAP